MHLNLEFCLQVRGTSSSICRQDTATLKQDWVLHFFGHVLTFVQKSPTFPAGRGLQPFLFLLRMKCMNADVRRNVIGEFFLFVGFKLSN